ncbi:MAG TPA: hypothetical protein VJ508_09540 [Saprospiraceae bacterium]|nr:hypothetical protein [Saprospiraceae bacterium]
MRKSKSYLELMKLALLLCLFSVSAFAQVKKESPDKKDKPVKFDSLDLDFSWDDVYRSAGWDCRCPDTTKVWQMPRELHPYQWVDNKKPIIIPDSTYRQWVKADEEFKKNYRRADSLMRAKQNPKPIQ